METTERCFASDDNSLHNREVGMRLVDLDKGNGDLRRLILYTTEERHTSAIRAHLGELWSRNTLGAARAGALLKSTDIASPIHPDHVDTEQHLY